MFKNMKIGQKMLFGFAVIIVVSVALAIVGLNGINTMSGLAKNISNNFLPGVDALHQMNEAKTEIRVAYYGLSNKEFQRITRDRMYVLFDSARQKYADARKSYELLPKSKEEELAWKSFLPEWDAWYAYAEEMIKIGKEKDGMMSAGISPQDPRIKESDDKFVRVLTEPLVVETYGKAENSLKDLIDINTKESAEASSAVATTSGNTSALMLISLIAGF